MSGLAFVKQNYERKRDYVKKMPNVYALKIEEEWREISQEGYDDTYWEVRPRSDWNYALIKNEIDKYN